MCIVIENDKEKRKREKEIPPQATKRRENPISCLTRKKPLANNGLSIVDDINAGSHSDYDLLKNKEKTWNKEREREIDEEFWTLMLMLMLTLTL